MTTRRTFLGCLISAVLLPFGGRTLFGQKKKKKEHGKTYQLTSREIVVPYEPFFCHCKEFGPEIPCVIHANCSIRSHKTTFDGKDFYHITVPKQQYDDWHDAVRKVVGEDQLLISMNTPQDNMDISWGGTGKAWSPTVKESKVDVVW